MTRHFVFVGVTTGSSSIVKIFPRWREALGLGDDVDLEGWDLPIHDANERYRETVHRLKLDNDYLGGLVTTHKIDLYQAAKNLFDWIDPYAKLTGEVSCLAKRGNQLHAWAKDPISAGKSLQKILGDGYFGRTGGHVLSFGAGGSAVAITLYLMTRPDGRDRPERIIVTNRSPGRLESMRVLHESLSSDVPVEYVQSSDTQLNDHLMAGLPPGSLVINATGMGKDTPGSPVSDAATFPSEGIAWELNYRGDLDFLYQAWKQRESRRLTVEDGWEYFIYGWTSVIEEVFERSISESDVEELSRLAAFARPDLPTNKELSTP